MQSRVQPTFFSTGAEFRSWLERHGAGATELLLGFHKIASGKDGIRYKQALDEALCFGWIDGVRKNFNPTSYTIRFTPRKEKSHWSLVNLARVAELKALGLMKPLGLAAFERRSAVRTINYSYETKAATLPASFEKTFKANRKAWEFFESQAPSYRRVAVFWVMDAKKEETRATRFARLLEDSAAGQRLSITNPANRQR